MRDLKELPITEETSLGDQAASAAAVAQGLRRVPDDTKEMAYQAWLGFYNSQSRLPWNKEQLVRFLAAIFVFFSSFFRSLHPIGAASQQLLGHHGLGHAAGS
jgi:hypothetical protein